MFRSVSVYLVVLFTLHFISECIQNFQWSLSDFTIAGSHRESGEPDSAFALAWVIDWSIWIVTCALGYDLTSRVASWMNAYDALRRVPSINEVKEYFGKIRRPITRLFLLAMVAPLFVVPYVAFIVSQAVDSALSPMVSSCVEVALYLFCYTLLTMAIPALALDGCSSWGSLSKGLAMMKGYWLWTSGMILVSLVGIASVFFGVSIFLGIVTALRDGISLDRPAVHVVVQVVATMCSVVVAMIATVFFVSGLLVNYASIRAAKEGRQLPRQVDTIGDPLKPSQEQ
jgi:hypothetical protein